MKLPSTFEPELAIAIRLGSVFIANMFIEKYYITFGTSNPRSITGEMIL
jgi:hypothetical protein